MDHGLHLFDIKTLHWQLPPQGVAVGLKAIAIHIHIDGIVVGTGFPGRLRTTTVANAQITLLPIGHNNQVAVLTQWHLKMLVKLNHSITKPFRVRLSCVVQGRHLTTIDQHLNSIDLHPVRALHLDLQANGALGTGGAP